MEIKECLSSLIEAVSETPELAAYNEARAKLKEYPEKMKRLQEYRKKNYRLQNSDEEIDLFTETDRMADAFRDVYQDPVMQNYLKAEAGLCKIVQWINASVISSLDFEPLSDDE